MNRGEIRRRILNGLNDDPNAPVYWSTSEIDDYIQDGMEVMAEESEALKRTFTIPRRAGIMIYHLEGIGDSIMAPYRIWLPDLKRRLDAWSITDLDGRQETWMTTTGDPWVWAPIDWQQFLIWPVPASAGGWLEVNCYVWPGAMIEDSDQPEFMPADHETLVDFGVQEGYMQQHDVMRAVDSTKRWASKLGSANTRASIEQMQSSFHVRERNRADGRE